MINLPDHTHSYDNKKQSCADQDALQVCASVCPQTGHRTYKLNNRTLPVKRTTDCTCSQHSQCVRSAHARPSSAARDRPQEPAAHSVRNQHRRVAMVRQLRLLSSPSLRCTLFRTIGVTYSTNHRLIQQNVVHKMANKTPIELASYVCEVRLTLHSL